MKKILSFIALVGLLIPTIASAYTVQSGDTLWRIAKSHNTTISQLVEDNGIKNPNLIYPGQELIMGGVLGATTKIKLTDTNAVTPAATSTPTANMIPIANASGTIDNYLTQTLYANTYSNAYPFTFWDTVTTGTAISLYYGYGATTSVISANSQNQAANICASDKTWWQSFTPITQTGVVSSSIHLLAYGAGWGAHTFYVVGEILEGEGASGKVLATGTSTVANAAGFSAPIVVTYTPTIYPLTKNKLYTIKYTFYSTGGWDECNSNYFRAYYNDSSSYAGGRSKTGDNTDSI